VPILNIVIQGERQKADGSKTPIQPALALVARGPVVEVSISVVEAVSRPILQAGGTVPAPVTGFALIDTGASHTCVDDDVANTLRLPVVGVANMTSATEANSQRNLYPIQIDFVGWNVKMASPRAMGANLKPQGLVALIGRDVLKSAILVYNGPMGSFSLSL
jgi:predicted aspartyl protease